MNAATLLLALVPQDDVRLTFQTPDLFIAGEPFPVTVRAEATTDGPAGLPGWALSAAGFDLDGVSLGARESGGGIELQPGQTIQTTFDLGETILESDGFQGRDFRLTFAAGSKQEPRTVRYLERAERGIDFMQLPVEQLGDYDVVLNTEYGPIWIQLWPDVAPNHVRNYLDLVYTGFYDDNHFHRVIPGFMIQGGGVPPGQKAPRRVKNEFNDRRHVAGVLAMARYPVDSTDEEGNRVPAFDSATTEFFIVHRVSPHLDGKYTALGKVVQGMEAVEKVVDSVKEGFNPNDPRTHKPRERQSILKAIAVKAPARRPGDE